MYLWDLNRTTFYSYWICYWNKSALIPVMADVLYPKQWWTSTRFQWVEATWYIYIHVILLNRSRPYLYMCNLYSLHWLYSTRAYLRKHYLLIVIYGFNYVCYRPHDMKTYMCGPYIASFVQMEPIHFIIQCAYENVLDFNKYRKRIRGWPWVMIFPFAWIRFREAQISLGNLWNVERLSLMVVGNFLALSKYAEFGTVWSGYWRNYVEQVLVTNASLQATILTIVYYDIFTLSSSNFFPISHI